MMWNRVVLLLVLSTFACTTSRAAWKSAGLGGGLVVGSAVFLGNYDDRAYGPTGAQVTAVFVALSGAALAVVSLIAVVPLSMHEANANTRAERAASSMRAVPQGPPGTVAQSSLQPIRIPLGATIRAEGSVCGGKLDVCAVGLACVAGTCRVPLQPRD